MYCCTRFVNPYLIFLITFVPSSRSVSYTHLDVYKRQGLHRAGTELSADKLNLAKLYASKKENKNKQITTKINDRPFKNKFKINTILVL